MEVAQLPSGVKAMQKKPKSGDKGVKKKQFHKLLDKVSQPIKKSAKEKS